jgi:hypothetical protein
MSHKSAYSCLALIAASLLSTSAFSQQEPIRIGFMTVRSGALAAGG